MACHVTEVGCTGWLICVHVVAGHKKLTEYPEVLEIAKKLNATPAQVLIAWGAKRGYSVIPKSVTPGTFASRIALFLPAC